MTLRWPMLLGLLAGLAAVALGLASGAGPVDGWERAARWTARAGLPLFLLTYAASSLARLWPHDWTRRLLRQRRWWGLGFAACHFVHLAALVMALQLNGEDRPLGALLAGALAYGVLALMALTSNNAAMRALGRNWQRLHRFGIHYLWLIYALAYAVRVVDPATQLEGIAGTGLCLAALALRLAAWQRRRRA